MDYGKQWSVLREKVIDIDKSNGTSIEDWETSALTLTYEENYPFNTTILFSIY